MESKTEPKRRSSDGRRAFLVVLLVAALGIATIGLPFVHGGMTTTAGAESTTVAESYANVSAAESDLGAADEIYLREDGSAVLRYDEDSDLNRLDLGMDVSEGLAYMLVVDEEDTETEEFERANVSAVLDRSGFAADGSLVVQQPEELEELHVDASGEVSEEANQFEATATGTFESPSATAGAVDTDGHVTVTGDRFETSGTASVEGAAGAAGDGTTFEVSLEETGDGYVLDVVDERSVSDFAAGDWETREQAERSLEQQYGAVAEQLGGTSEIHLSHYEYENRSSGPDRLELEFTIEYSGIDAGVEAQLAAALAADEEADLSESEAEAIAERVTELEIETVEFSMAQSDGSLDVAWNVAIANADELSLAIVDLLEASAASEELAAEDLEDARTAIEAQQAAELEWTLEWEASVEQTSTDQLQFSADVSSETENWEAYVAELEENGIEIRNGVSFDLTAETDGGELAVDAAFEVEAEDLARRAVESWAQSIEDDPATSGEAERFVAALTESDLEVARVDADLDGETVRVEGGAKFDNASAMTEVVSDDVVIGGIATEQSGDTASTYVYVDDMGDVDAESATRSDLEHLGVVDSETTVHGPGEWDEEFPEVDTAAMASYLGVDTGEDGTDGNETSDDGDEPDDDETEDSVPGFGAGIAAVAALLSALALGRRTQ